MPRHLISDAHEWINEIPTVPTYYLAKPQPREPNGAGFGVLLFKELTLVFVKVWLARPATVYRESLPSLTLSVTTLGPVERACTWSAARSPVLGF